MESKKVIYIHLKGQSFGGKTDFYFGSIAAIYETLNHDILGIKQSTLMQYLWHRNGEYENERCKVSTGEIIRKASTRTQK